MAQINYDRLVKDFSLMESEQPTRGPNPGRGGRHLREAFAARSIAPSDIDLGRLFEACFGIGAYRAGRSGELATRLMEDAGPVASNAFQQISGQQLFSEFLGSYQSEDFVFTKMIPTVQSPFPLGEKIPGVTDPSAGDPYADVPEQEEFPQVGVSENYIETPDKHTYGRRIGVTRLAIFGDRTGQLLEKVGKVSRVLGIGKEKRAIDVVLDENQSPSGFMRYKWRGDTIATYGDNSGTHSWDNLQAANGLVDFNNIGTAEQLFANMLDPETGEPISILADTIITAPQLSSTVFRILHATSVNLSAGGFAVTGNLFRTDAASPLGKTEYSSQYMPVSSRLLKARMAVATSWYIGAPRQAFRWQSNWAMRLLTAPPLSHEEFTRDIVVQHRFDERGVFATIDPRYMVKCTVA